MAKTKITPYEEACLSSLVGHAQNGNLAKIEEIFTEFAGLSYRLVLGLVVGNKSKETTACKNLLTKAGRSFSERGFEVTMNFDTQKPTLYRQERDATKVLHSFDGKAKTLVKRVHMPAKIHLLSDILTENMPYLHWQQRDSQMLANTMAENVSLEEFGRHSLQMAVIEAIRSGHLNKKTWLWHRAVEALKLNPEEADRRYKDLRFCQYSKCKCL